MQHLLIPIITIVAIVGIIRALQHYELKKFQRTATTLDRCYYAGRSYLIVKATKDQVAIEMRQNFPVWVDRKLIEPCNSLDITKEI